MAEFWDLLDKDGNNIGIKWTRENRNKIPDGLYFPCVEIWVMVGDRLLITKRHPDKHEGLKYDVPGGAVVSGESIPTGAIRELSEEVGLFATTDRLIHLGCVTVDKVYATSYLLRLEELPQIILQPSEVVGYKLVTADELEEMSDQLTKGTHRRYLLYKDQIFG